MHSFTRITLSLAASLALAGAAHANPGGVPNGGIGAGGGLGGGMGAGGGFGGFGAGAGAGAHGAIDLPSRGANGTIGLDTASSARTFEHARPNTLDSNVHLQTALTNSLTRGGVSLPAGGVSAACSGFSNLGTCVAAMHAAQNLGITGGFTALKAEMTGPGKAKLGDAIKRLRPDADAKLVAKRAKAQARAELRASAETMGD